MFTTLYPREHHDTLQKRTVFARSRCRRGPKPPPDHARSGLTLNDVVRRTRLDEQTIRALLHGEWRPHARTMQRLASGLGVDVEELFSTGASSARRRFDRRTNPAIDALTRSRPQLFDGWTPSDFDDLYSRFGTGGELTVDGALECATAVNRRRRVMMQVGVLLETGEGELLESLVEALYRRVAATSVAATAQEVADRLQPPPAVAS